MININSLRLCYGLNDQGIGIQFPAGARDIQTGSGAYQVSCPVALFLGAKRPGRHLHGAALKHWNSCTLTLPIRIQH
jgi:hypothetical protein